MIIEAPMLVALAGGVFGLLVGSFINVVAYRLPIMMDRQWKRECAELNDTPVPEGDRFNLMLPRSRCSHCGHQIRWYENIPVLSFLALRGRCSSCSAKIGLRYPLVEAFTGVVFSVLLYRWGPTPWGLAWCTFCGALIALTLIDWDTTLLPDDITLPLIWGGLFASAMHWTPVPLEAAFWGAVAGYLSLWSIYWVFKLVTGKEGMGYGDFKLFAALGVWFGWSALVPMILTASIAGALVGLVLKFRNTLREGLYVPFGPFLALAGLTSVFWGPDLPLQILGLRG